MYESFYSLAPRPFAESVDPAAWVALPSREAVCRRIQFAIDHAQGAALLFGAPGAGKSMIARRLAAVRPGPVVELAYPALPRDEIVQYLASELGCGSDGESTPGRAEMVRRLRDRLASQAQAGARVLLVVDDVQTLDGAEALETLRLLLNFRTGGSPDLDLLLCGHTQAVLNIPPAFFDRLAARCLVPALDEVEAQFYLTTRLEVAGARRPLFTPEAVAALHRSADGLPRRMNRLADLSLLLAAAREQSQVDAALVSIAARDYPAQLP